jgi:hypothetical protein
LPWFDGATWKIIPIHSFAILKTWMTNPGVHLLP